MAKYVLFAKKLTFAKKNREDGDEKYSAGFCFCSVILLLVAFHFSGIARGEAVLASPVPPTEGEVVADAQTRMPCCCSLRQPASRRPSDLSKRLRRRLLAKGGLVAMMHRHDAEVSSSVHRSCLRALGALRRHRNARRAVDHARLVGETILAVELDMYETIVAVGDDGAADMMKQAMMSIFLDHEDRMSRRQEGRMSRDTFFFA